MWNDWLGDIGDAPPLPNDIGSILASPCPFNPGKKVIETHMLVLVPEKLDGTPMTLDRLGKLMESLGKPSYRNPYCDEYEETPFETSHWVLMTKNVIEKSRGQSYREQINLVKKHPNYRVLKLVEAVTAIFMEYLATDIQHFNENLLTFTRCQEESSNGYQMVVGGFAPSGLSVDYFVNDRSSSLAVARKF